MPYQNFFLFSDISSWFGGPNDFDQLHEEDEVDKKGHDDRSHEQGEKRNAVRSYEAHGFSEISVVRESDAVHGVFSREDKVSN